MSLSRIATFSAMFFLFTQVASATPPPNETTINSDDVSRIELNTSVSKQSGSYNQTFPIIVPEGRAGLTPTIALEYSSQLSDYTSPVGYGWSINIPFIERVNKTGLGKLFTSNYFLSSIDGELVASSSTSYRPEIESGAFNTYTFSNANWVLYDKSGTKYIYGSTSNARLDNAASSSQISRWYLSEIINTNGNRVAFTYFKDSGQIYPDTIEYSFVGTASLHKIVFERASTTARVSYKNSFPIETRFNISNINTYFNNNILKNYKLDFATHASSVVPLLASIQETGVSEQLASTTLPKSTFKYSSTSGSLSWQNDQIWASSTPNDLSWKFRSYPSGEQSFYNRVSIQDMNGDALPDWVYGDQVYLNTGNGWAASSLWPALPTNDWTLDFRFVDLNGDLLPDIIQSKDITYDPQLSGHTNSKIRTAYINNGNGTWATSTSVAANIPTELYTEFWTYPSGIQYTKTKVDFVDMNGDGLTDWVTNGYVYLNNGNGWSTSTAWSGLPVSFEKTAKLADINGDGLPDIVTSEQQLYHPIYNIPTAYYRSCLMNQGNGTWVNDAECQAHIPGDLFIRYQDYNTNPLVTYSYNDVYLTDLTGDGLADWYVSGTLYPNTGRGWSTSTAYSVPVSAYDLSRNYRLEDVNGDQLPDYVHAESLVWDQQFDPDIPTTVQRETLINQGKKAWLLATTTNIFGGTTAISYKSSTALVNSVIQNPQNPYSLYTVSAVEVDAGFGAKTKTTYNHSGADLYTKSSDPFARRFAGFETVTSADSLSQTKTYYHQGNSNATTSNEVSDEYAKIGRAYKTDVFDLNNNLYRSTSNLFATSSPAVWSTYVRLTGTTKRDFDGDADHKDSAITYVNNVANGNLSQQIEWGEVTANADGSFTDTGTDKRTVTYAYATNTTFNIIGLLSSDRLDNQSGIKVKESRYYYDTLALGSVNKGNLTKKEDWATSTTYINTQSSCNSFGLKTQDLDPRGNATNYVYDSYNLFPATTTNALSQSTRYTYDYSSGKVKTIVDANGFTHEIVFDGLDRPIEIKEPRGTSGALVTIETNAYTDIASKTSVLNQKFLDTTTSVLNYSYLDKLGRTIQTRREGEGTNQYAVKDFIYGNHGYLSKESLLYFSDWHARTSPTSASILLSAFSYDALGRTVSVNTVIGTTSSSYDQNTVTVIDTLNNQKQNQYDAYGRVSGIQEQNGTSTYVTSYQWTAHNQLAQITDALGNIRNFSYDGLGRRTRAEDLHAAADTTYGVWTYVYDAVGNIATTTNPKSQVTLFTYDALNRPLTENFTGQAGTEGVYTYDTCTNGKGYVCVSNSTAATTTVQYNPAGLVSTEQKTISGTNYTQSTLYDRQNNPLEITYPDSSIVRYSYNTAGQLERVEQKENVGTYRDIISNYNYAPYGAVEKIVYGNGVVTVRTYDNNEMYRLRSIKTTATTTFGTGGPGPELPIFEDATELLTSIGIVTGEVSQTLVPAIDTPSVDGVVALMSSTTSDIVSTSTPISVESIPGGVTMPEDTLAIPTSTTTFLVGNSQLDVVKQRVAERLEYVSNQKALDKSFAEDSDTFDLKVRDINAPNQDIIFELAKSVPEVRIKKWNGEMNFSIRYADFETATSEASSKNLIRWKDKKGTTEVHAYPLAKTADTENGDFEVEVVLEEKPKSNIFYFTLTGYENLDFYYQPALNADAMVINDPDIHNCTETECKNIKDETVLIRDENIVGSYAVYHKDKTGQYEHMNYATGKAFHIFRPKVIDAAGNEVWATMNYQEGVLSITVPEEFLATATYPVIVDPTFGVTSVGASIFQTTSNTDRVSAIKASPTNSGVMSSINFYSSVVSGASTIGVALYRDSAGVPTDLIKSQDWTAYTSVNTTPAWRSGALSEIVQGGVSYWLAMTTDYESRLYYDSVSSSRAYKANNQSFYPPPFPIYFSGVTYDNKRFSIYANYVPNDVPIAPTALQVDGEINPVGIVDATPEFTAVYEDLNAFDMTTKYQIQVSTSSMFTGLVWDTGSTSLTPTISVGATSGVIVYSGPALASSTLYYWRMKFWDNFGDEGLWSAGTNTFSVATGTPPIPPFVFSPGGIQNLLFTYDSVGNITMIVDTGSLGSAATTTYQYDGLYRLTRASTTNAAQNPYLETYAYNAIGNLTNKSNVGNYTYQGNTGSLYVNPHAPTSVNGVTYTYDRNGNLATTSAGLTNTWDYNNRLTNTLNSGGTTAYTYDVNEQRVTKTVGGITTRYPSSRYEVAGATTTKHLYAGDSLLASITTTASTTPKTSYIHPDHLGSTNVITDDTGSSTNLYTYYPYGSSRFIVGGNTATSSPLYIDAVASNWTNNSWNTTITNSTSTVYSGTQSLKVVYNAIWGGVSYSRSLNTAPFSTLDFYTYIAATSTPNLYLYFTNASGTLIQTVNLTSYASLTTGTWQHVSVPLSTLGITNYNNTLTFNIESNQLTTVYYDQIQFLGTATSTAGFSEPNQFIGQDRDQEADLSYLNARYYRANNGQFLSQDPVFWEIGQTPDGTRVLLDPQLQNSYSYGRGNPVVNKDPEGRIIPLLVGAYVLAEAALSAYDAYDTFQTVTSQSTSNLEKGASLGGFAIGMVAPGAGYGKGSKEAVKTLYHYTDNKGLEGILKSGKLNPSLKANNINDARYGDGQYFSDIKPGVLSNGQLGRKFINRPNQYKFTNYIEIEASKLNLIKGRDGVYLNPSTEPLDISRLIKSAGKN